MSEADETTEVEVDDVYTGDDAEERPSFVSFAKDDDADGFGDEFKTRVFAAVRDRLDDLRDERAQTFFGGLAPTDDAESE